MFKGTNKIKTKMQENYPALCNKPIKNKKPENIVFKLTSDLHYKNRSISTVFLLIAVKKC